VAAAIELLACGYPARCSVRRCQIRATTVVHVALYVVRTCWTSWQRN
jgi:hypothetical protein